MSCAAQSERQLGDGLLRKELVDGESDLVATEARQFGVKRRGIDFHDEFAGTAAENLAMRPVLGRQDLIER